MGREDGAKGRREVVVNGRERGEWTWKEKVGWEEGGEGEREDVVAGNGRRDRLE